MDKIQLNYNSDLHTRMKNNIKNLISKQVNLNLNYLVIKKLEIKEDFTNSLKLGECEK
jgi:hypothetical protein